PRRGLAWTFAGEPSTAIPMIHSSSEDVGFREALNPTYELGPAAGTELVGWVERSDTHHSQFEAKMLGFAKRSTQPTAGPGCRNGISQNGE
ncbi:hypothetical protein, partial [Bradyrhizobium sp.]|uniref:hypothetical protein n=1 Tax=Bradyrhizobium sp. TaxID=376 RepID=UPI003C187DB6